MEHVAENCSNFHLYFQLELVTVLEIFNNWDAYLGRQLLAGRLATSWFTSGLFGTGHIVVYVWRRETSITLFIQLIHRGYTGWGREEREERPHTNVHSCFLSSRQSQYRGVCTKILSIRMTPLLILFKLNQFKTNSVCSSGGFWLNLITLVWLFIFGEISENFSFSPISDH